jgi:hypothetical protein
VARHSKAGRESRLTRHVRHHTRCSKGDAAGERAVLFHVTAARGYRIAGQPGETASCPRRAAPRGASPYRSSRCRGARAGRGATPVGHGAWSVWVAKERS